MERTDFRISFRDAGQRYSGWIKGYIVLGIFRIGMCHWLEFRRKNTSFAWRGISGIPGADWTGSYSEEGSGVTLPRLQDILQVEDVGVGLYRPGREGEVHLRRGGLPSFPEIKRAVLEMERAVWHGVLRPSTAGPSESTLQLLISLIYWLIYLSCRNQTQGLAHAGYVTYQSVTLQSPAGLLYRQLAQRLSWSTRTWSLLPYTLVREAEREKEPEDGWELCETLSSGHSRALHDSTAAVQDLHNVKPARMSEEMGKEGLPRPSLLPRSSWQVAVPQGRRHWKFPHAAEDGPIPMQCEQH